jgi:photosystem II stability/assembly factor-like uncharacterized protein
MKAGRIVRRIVSTAVIGLARLAVPLLLAGAAGASQGADAAVTLQERPAAVVAHASRAALLGAARAGERMVAVGDHGVVLLSDDDGRQWRQARAVPVGSTLTSVSFADERHGWAVGHWGAVLATRDGGETWDIARLDASEDRPLFAVHAFDARHLVAVGLWSLVLTSADGGKSWTTVKLPPPPAAEGRSGGKADLNLFGLAVDDRGVLYAAGERGMVLRSEDRGANWSYLPTGYKGSFWAVASPAAGVLVAAGLRGSIWRSGDAGKSWSRIDGQGKSSVTALVRDGGELLALGLDGLLLRSADQAARFAGTPRADRAALTAALRRADGSLVLFSRSGVVKP